MKKTIAKRDLFAEIMEGVDSMRAMKQGKVTLKTHKITADRPAKVPGPDYFIAARERFNVSRAVWAQMLHVSPRTVEKWEQAGQASPLAATFVELVSTFPDTIERLQSLPRNKARIRTKRAGTKAPAPAAVPRRTRIKVG